MLDVPSEIFREILLRLPAETLFRFRSVCKEWLRVIDHPSFIKAHANNQLYNHTLLVRDRSGPLFYSFSIDSLNYIKGPQTIDVTPIKQLIRPGVSFLPLKIYHEPFCNGLILISAGSDIKMVWAIWNPLTKEHHELPQPNSDSKSYGLSSVGFGYDNEADDYKVVRIDKSVSGRYQTLIYSLKLGSWRKIEDCPYRTDKKSTFLNGTLYWLSPEVEDKILALDLGTESYSQLPLPPVDIQSEYHKYDCILLGLYSLDGCLICCLDYKRRHIFEGWVMTDNGVEQTWIKLFSLQYFFCMQYYPDNISGKLRLVAYLKSKQQVVLQHDWGFLWFDIRKNSVLRFSIHGLPQIISSKICPGSLVLLNSRAGAVTAAGTLTRKRKKTTERTDTRMKFCLRNVWEKCCSDNHNCSEGSCRHCKEE